MVGNPPDLNLGQSKTTLLVVPSSAIQQWLKEIEKHVKPGVFKKITHYKRTEELTMANLEDQDIINMSKWILELFEIGTGVDSK